MLADMQQVIKRGKPLKEGDVLFFKRGRRITHVAIYLKDNKFIHAATERRGVVVDDLRGAYYRRSFFVAGSPFKKDDSIAISE
jgi:lipoprotein Spr